MDKYDLISLFTDFYIENKLSEEEYKGGILFLDFLLKDKNNERKDD